MAILYPNTGLTLKHTLQLKTEYLLCSNKSMQSCVYKSPQSKWYWLTHTYTTDERERESVGSHSKWEFMTYEQVEKNFQRHHQSFYSPVEKWRKSLTWIHFWHQLRIVWLLMVQRAQECVQKNLILICNQSSAVLTMLELWVQLSP